MGIRLKSLFIFYTLILLGCGGTRFKSVTDNQNVDDSGQILSRSVESIPRSKIGELECGQILLTLLNRPSIDPTKVFESRYVAEKENVETIQVPILSDLAPKSLQRLNKEKRNIERELQYLTSKNQNPVFKEQFRIFKKKQQTLERKIQKEEIKIIEARLNSIILETAKEERAIVLLPPQNFQVLSKGDEYQLRPDYLLARPTQSGILEGLFPSNQSYRIRYRDKEESKIHQEHVNLLLKNKKVLSVPYQIRGRTVVLRDGEERIVEEIGEDDTILYVLADEKKRPYIQGLTLLTAAQKDHTANRRPASRPLLSPYQSLNRGEEEVSKSINRRFQKKGKTNGLVITQKLSTFSALDYPLRAYTPNGDILQIHKGPVGNPHLHLRRFILKSKDLGFYLHIWR